MKAKTWAALGLVLGMVGCGAGSGSGSEVLDETAVESQREALASNALSVAEQKAVLKAVDDICGDTWCAGDYNFAFQRIACSRAARACTLALQVIPREGVPTTRPSYWRACRTHGFTGFDSLVVTAPGGFQSLVPEYYDALTECIGRIEENLPKPRPTSNPSSPPAPAP